MQLSQDLSEILPARRPFTWSFFLVLFFAVVPLWSAVPLAWAFVIYALRSGHLFLWGWQLHTLFALCLCEVFFTVYYQVLAWQISPPANRCVGTLHELQVQFHRILKTGLADLPEDGYDEESLAESRPGSPAEKIVQLEPTDHRAIDFRNALRTWFHRVPWSAICRDDMRRWLYWSIFNSVMPPYESIPDADRMAVDEVLGLLEKRVGRTIPEKSGSPNDIPPTTVTPILLTLDKVNIKWRPLFYYVTIYAINACLRLYCRRKWDVRPGSYDSLEYILRVPPQWNAATGPQPIVFIHGLGVGLLQYIMQLSHLLEEFPDRPFLFLVQPAISQDIFHPHFLKPMNRHETAGKLANLLEALGWVDLSDDDSVSDCSTPYGKDGGFTRSRIPRRRVPGVTMISHSNGSYIHAWMLKGYPKIIDRSCFVDPVAFCSWEGDVCYNFLYRPSRTGIELLMRYFVGTELGVANLLQRNFAWADNSLYYEEIPNARDYSRTLFIIGGQDAIVAADRVRKYLTSHGVRKNLCYVPDAPHGQSLLAGTVGHQKIMRWIRCLL